MPLTILFCWLVVIGAVALFIKVFPTEVLAIAAGLTVTILGFLGVLWAVSTLILYYFPG